MIPATDLSSGGTRASGERLSGLKHWDPSTRAQEVTGRYSDIKVLYVGREPFLREEVISRLDIWFSMVHSAADGGEALFMIRRSMPNIVVIDAETPDGGGIAAALEIRLAAPWAEVILLAVDGDPEAFSDLARLDLTCHCMMSPVRDEDLRGVIDLSLERIQRERGVFGPGWLSAARASLPNIMDHRGELIWAVDSRLRFTFLNRSFRAAHHEITGVVPHEGMHAIGTGCSEPGGHFWNIQEHYDRAMRGECVSFVHEAGVSGQGRRFEITLSPFKAWGAPAAGVSGIARVLSGKPPQATVPASTQGANDTVLSEVHHRVRNNFLLVQSLLRLQSRGITDETARELLAASENRINVLSLLHNGLASDGSGLDVDMERYIQSLAVMLVRRHQRSDRTIRMTVDARNARLHARLAIPCGLLVNELVSEALRRLPDVPGTGDLYVGLSRNRAGMMELRVKDNGPARSDVMEVERGSMRCEVVRVLVEQLRGCIHDKGTNAQNGILLEFPG